MRDTTFRPTPHPAVNEVLAALLAGLRAALGDQLIGLVLYGSLALGDFDLRTSDIDFVGVTAAALPAGQVQALGRLHARLGSSGLPLAAHLEGSYLPRADLRRYDPAGGPYPVLNEGRFYMARHESDWVIQRWVLREHGLVLAGPPPVTLIDPLTPADLRGAVRRLMAEWWVWHLGDTHRVREPDYQAYAVLSMCRALHTLERGEVASKPVSARWAQAALGEPAAALIGEALAWRAGAPFDHLDATLALIRCACARAGVSLPGRSSDRQETPP